MASKVFSTKLKNLRLKAGYSQKEVYEKFGIPQSTFSSWEVGKSEPSGEMLLKLCDFYKCDMMKEFSSDENLTCKEWEFIETYRSLDSDGRELIDMVLERETRRVQLISELRQKLTTEDNHIAPTKAGPATIIELSPQLSNHCHLTKYFRDASAGSGIFILGNEVSSQISVSEADWDDRIDYVIRVNGDSMLPDYQDGDNVMVSQRMEMHYGDVGIFVVNGKAYIKEYGQTELISRNFEFPNVSIGEHDNIVCMGKVIGKLTGPYEIVND